MDEAVRKKKDELMEAIRQSGEWQAFSRCREQLKGHEQLRAQLDSFRSRAYLLQVSSMGEQARQEEENLLAEQTRLMKDPLLAGYLRAEQAYCRMLREICIEALSVSDLEIDSFISCV